MRYWHRFAALFPAWNYSAQRELVLAYRAVFQGTPSKQQQEAVLSDLAARCHWNQVKVPDSSASDRELWFREGKRAAFAEVFSHLSLSPGDIEALDNAARHEAALLKLSDA